MKKFTTCIIPLFILLNAFGQNEFLYEDFSSGSYFQLYSSVEANAFLNNDKAVLTGGSDWVWYGNGDSTNAQNAWIDNIYHHATASEYIDASNYNAIELKIKFTQISEQSTKHSWFRVLVNGLQRSDLCGQENFNPKSLSSDPYQTYTFDLSDMAGQVFVLSFQSACKLLLQDAVFIDEIRLIAHSMTTSETLPLNFDFNMNSLPSGWTSCASDSSVKWRNGYSVSLSASNEYVFAENIPGDGLANQTKLILPAVNLQYQQNIQLQADVWNNLPLYLVYSPDSGQSWTDTITQIAASAGQWQSQNISLNTYSGDQHALFAFALDDTSDIASLAAIDNLQFSALNTSGIDLSCDSLLSPQTQVYYSASEILASRFTNNGTTALNSFQISYQVNGGLIHSQTIDTLFTPSGTLDLNFIDPVDLSAIGTYEIKTWISAAYDTLTSNDTLISVLEVSIPVISSFPYLQSFENEQYWQSGGSNSSWALGQPQGAVVSSASEGDKAWVTNLSGIYNVYEGSWVRSPVFDLSGISLPVISFDLLVNTDPVEDGVCLQYSTNGGLTWTVIGQAGDPNNWYNSTWVTALYTTGQNNGWSGTNSNAWFNVKYFLPVLAGEQEVFFRLFFGSTENFGLYEGIGFDHVKLFDQPQTDVGLTAILHPNYDCLLGSNEQVSIRIKNFGLSPVNQFDFQYWVNGSASNIESLTQTLMPDSSLTFTFNSTSDFSAPVNYQISAKVSVQGDALAYNDSLSTDLQFVEPMPLPFSEDFENAALPSGWSRRQNTGSNGWTFGPDQQSFYFPIPTHTSYAASNDDTCYCDMSQDFLITPYFDFTTYDSISLSFQSYYSGYFGSTAHIKVSTDCGNTWTNVYDLTGVPTGWQNVQVDLSAYSGMDRVKIAFHHNDNGNWASGFAIDNVEIDGNLLIGSQEIVLNQGWGIVSSYIDPFEPLFDSICQNLLPNLVIMKAGNGTVYWPEFGVNSIGYWQLEQGYYYFTNQADTFFISGYTIYPENILMSIPQGWSIVSYLRTTPADAALMFQSIQSEIILMKDENGLVYWPAFSLNMIGNLLPGKGYQINLYNPADFYYPPN